MRRFPKGEVIGLFAVRIYHVEVLCRILDDEFTKGGLVYEYPCHVVVEMEDTNYGEAYLSMKDFKDDIGKHYLKLTQLGFL